MWGPGWDLAWSRVNRLALARLQLSCGVTNTCLPNLVLQYYWQPTHREAFVCALKSAALIRTLSY
jgi:hypothetical protein